MTSPAMLLSVRFCLISRHYLKSIAIGYFLILERTEELSVPKGKDRSDRNIGYMGETLETLYFIKNVDKLNVVHTECKLYT